MLNDFKPAASQTVAFQFFACADALPDFDKTVLLLLADGRVVTSLRLEDPSNEGGYGWFCHDPQPIKSPPTHWAALQPLKAEPVAAFADLADALDLTESTDTAAEVQADALVEIAAWMPTLAAALCAKADPAALAAWADAFAQHRRAA